MNLTSASRTCVSVVVPTYNMGEYVVEAVQSVLKQRGVSFEVLVVDDGSTDDTRDRLRSLMHAHRENEAFDARLRYCYQENAGKSAAVNHGFRKIHGDYALMLDADDTLAPGALVALHEAVSASGPGSIAVGGFEAFDEHGSLGVRPAPSQASPRQVRQLFYLGAKTSFHLNACLIPFALIQKTGGLDASLRRCIDGDYAIRLLAHASRIVPVEQTVYRYRKHRSAPGKRLRFRARTAYYRQCVLAKNFSLAYRFVAQPCALAIDLAKACFEVVARYRG